MWMASILQVLVLGAVDPPPLAASAMPAPIYWRQTLFSIPFHVERAAAVAQEAVEVQLHVSGDRGAHWDNWRQTSPEKGFFLFKAGADGEYWFDVRTLDRSGQVRPQGPHTPQLIVIVDTAPPKVQLSASRGDAGQVTVTFDIEEPNPKLDSLTLEHRLGLSQSWQTVPVGPLAVRSNNNQHSGVVTFYPQDASSAIDIRLRISDLAGNPAESHTNVLPVPMANPVRPATGTAAAVPAATNPRNGSTSYSNPPAATIASATQVKPADPFQPLGPPTGRTTWPAETMPPASTAGPPVASFENGQGTSVAFHVNPPVANQFVSETPPAAPVAESARANPFSGFTAGPLGGTATAPAAGGEIGPPRGVKLRWINTHAFSLDYDTQVMGATGPVPVELWGTRDGGNSWQSFGKDPKGRSPMLVTVPEEGVYGFQMVVETDRSKAGRSPLPGERPSLWIGIDWTRPVGKITMVQQGTGRDGDKLFIAWEASDNRELDARPIALSYSERLGGPWTSMASGLENTGHYAWQLSGSLPQRIFLRLEIHDAAGNMGIYETPQPVTLDISSPAAQLRDLRPLGQLDSRPGEQAYQR